MDFHDKTVLITGSSRGIGKAIALKLASAGANIVIAAKSVTEDRRLGGTIYSAASEVEAAGGNALAVFCDLQDEKLIGEAVEKTQKRFGGLDIVVHNASAINLSGTAAMETKRFDLLFDINVRGMFLLTRFAYPLLKASPNPHLLTMAPPVPMDMKWFRSHPAYSLSKCNMSMLAEAWSGEFKKEGIASNTLWPATLIATAAIRNMPGGETIVTQSRKPEIVADAAFHILRRKAKTCTGHHFIDEQVLNSEGITDFTPYAVTAGGPLQPDLFL